MTRCGPSMRGTPARPGEVPFPSHAPTVFPRFHMNKLTCLLLAPFALSPLVHAAEPVWLSEQPVPKAAELSELKGVRFHVIKANEPAKDGYKWMKGVALAWHKGKL